MVRFTTVSVGNFNQVSRHIKQTPVPKSLVASDRFVSTRLRSGQVV
jgi:hypothetical protein